MQSSSIDKYASKRVPRYTSYPTALQFTTDFDAETYASWLAQIPHRHAVSLYVHVPYCRSMCWYCGCHTKVTRRDGPIDAYMNSLNREIDEIADSIQNPIVVRHLHFGGGTPTIIGPDHIDDLMTRLHHHFEFAENAEIAIEVDPRTLTRKMTEALGAAGVNRASLGIQTFDPEVQRAINRIQPFDEAKHAADWLRKAGIGKLNFDLIYGLPKQTVDSCLETARQSLDLGPDRISVFGYAHLPSFKKHQRMILEADLPDKNMRVQQFDAIRETLCEAGFVPIGFDHFARPEDELATAGLSGELHRNFQGYTTDPCDTLIGLGASSIGRFPQGFAQNEQSTGSYNLALQKGDLPIRRGYQLSTEDKLRGAIIERLMCNYQVDAGAVLASDPGLLREVLDHNDALNQMIEDGLVKRSGNSLFACSDHRFLIRNIASCFDAYLGQARSHYSKAS